MPTGASLLLAACVLLAAGFGGGVSSTLGVRRRVFAAWTLCTAAASAVNLGWPNATYPAVLVNPGGCLVPLGFALFLLTSRADAGSRRTLWKVSRAAGAAAVLLAAGTAYGEQLGAPGPAAALAALAAAGAALSLASDARGALIAVAAGLVVSCALLAGLAWVGWAPWPPTLGGGVTFDAGVLAAIGTQVLNRAAAAWRAQQVGGAAFRASPH